MDPFFGLISAFGFNFAPYQWAMCYGQLMQVNQNTALFALLNTQYGGDGRTTFGLPDLCGRAAVGFGQGPGLSNYVMGQIGGAETTILDAAHLPAHTHTFSVAIKVNNSAGGITSPVSAFPGVDGSGSGTQYAPSQQTTPPPPVVMAPVNGPTALSPAGGSTPVNLLRPIQALNYCIALYGIFPSRA
jgi:microcystin-dependent protein